MAEYLFRFYWHTKNPKVYFLGLSKYPLNSLYFNTTWAWNQEETYIFFGNCAHFLIRPKKYTFCDRGGDGMPFELYSHNNEYEQLLAMEDGIPVKEILGMEDLLIEVAAEGQSVID